MDIFFFLIFAYIVLQVLPAVLKSNKTKPQPKPRAAAPQSGSDDKLDLQSRLRAAQAARSTLAQKTPRSKESSPPVKDSNDKNSRRRSDWGKRAGPEILSTQNILLGIMFAAIIYLVLRVVETF